MAPRGRATQQSQDTWKTNKASPCRDMLIVLTLMLAPLCITASSKWVKILSTSPALREQVKTYCPVP